MTRSSPRNRVSKDCHRLNFFYDDDDGCAITVLVRGYRFHIIADAARLKAQSGKTKHLEQKYRALLSVLRKQDADENKTNDPVIHGMEEELDAADVHQTESQDSGIGGSDSESLSRPDDDDNDSAIGAEESKSSNKQKKTVQFSDTITDLSDEEQEDPEWALQNWILEPFADIFQDLDESTGDDDGQQTLEEWYSGPTYFYQLEIKDDELTPIELESQPDLEKRISDLVPRVHVPNYITGMDVPWFKAEDLIVISESDEPDPYHPSRVKAGGDIYFLKLVDTAQPQPLKRELKILHEIENKKLYERFKVPRLQGLVGFESSKTEITGFLLTDIADPTPLTKMLDSDVIEEKREKWAKESEQIIKILHENKIVWGDAKADNFMIDRHGELWIIDFGGSYTDGWVDPELMETKEGDRMGIGKIVNALKDPESNTYDPEDETEVNDEQKEEKVPSKKRPHSEDADNDQEKEPARSSKRRKSGSGS